MARFDGLLAEPAIATPSLCTPKKTPDHTRSQSGKSWTDTSIWATLKFG
jgi:hypothetical protein